VSPRLRAAVRVEPCLPAWPPPVPVCNSDGGPPPGRPCEIFPLSRPRFRAPRKAKSFRGFRVVGAPGGTPSRPSGVVWEFESPPLSQKSEIVPSGCSHGPFQVAHTGPVERLPDKDVSFAFPLSLRQLCFCRSPRAAERVGLGWWSPSSR